MKNGLIVRGVLLSYSLAMIAQVSLPMSAMAQQVRTAPAAAATRMMSSPANVTRSTASSAPVRLDLSSTRSTLRATNTSAVQIHVGGTLSHGSVLGGAAFTVNPGQVLTPSQFFAMNQVMLGNQTLLLGNLGQATGGYGTINSAHVNSLASIIVPQHVALDAIGYSSSSPLIVHGALSIGGSVYALQSAPGLTAALNLGSLTVHSGGLLSASLPNGVNLGSNVYASAGMNISSASNVVNMGTISSPGILNITAGGNISNISVNNIAAVVHANTVSLNAASGLFINSGSITADSNINISTATGQDLVFNNTSGLLQSLSGNINFRDASYTGGSSTNVSGGNLLSEQLNLFGGNGAVNVHADNITGLVNVGANTIAVTAATPNLQFGNVIGTGDPLLVNTAGDVTINGAFGGGASSVIASGDVLAGPGSSIATAGGDLFIASGANIQGSGPYIITGPKSPTGGKIDLTGMASINTAGGAVTMAAFDGGNVNSGRIIIPTAVITTSGGNVNLTASDRNAALLNAIAIAGVNTTGGAVGSGSITLKATDLPTNINVIVQASGAVSNLNQITGFAGPGLPRNIVVSGNLVANGSAIYLQAGDGTANGNILITGQVLNQATAGNAGSFTVLQNCANPFVIGSATVNGIGNAANALVVASGAAGSGGTISITNAGTGGITVNNANSNISAAATSGTGAIYSLLASNPATNLATGPVVFTGVGTLNANAAGAASAQGGSITINSTAFTVTANPTFTANGVVAGAGGAVTIISSLSTNNIAIGAGAANINVSAKSGASGGDGGAITILAGGNLSVDVTDATAGPAGGAGVDANGANYTFQAGFAGVGQAPNSGNLFLQSASLSANGNKNGTAGKIFLISNSNLPFLIDGAIATGNGIAGAFGLSARGGTVSGDGGTISAVNTGTGGVTITSPALVDVSPQGSGNGGKLIATSTGVITIAGGTYNGNAGTGNKDGGKVDFEGSAVVINPSANVVMSANGSGTGKGGTVILKSTGAGSALTVGAASGQFQLSATGGSAGSSAGDGGSITAWAGAGLTVSSTASLNAASLGTQGKGATYDLEAGLAGAGNLLVSGSLDASGKGTAVNPGNGGSITLVTNTAGAAFDIGSVPSSVGVLGTITAAGGSGGGNGGSITVINKDVGGITIDTTNNLNVRANNGSAGQIIVNAEFTLPKAGPVTIPITAGANTIDVSATAGSSSGGSVTILGATLITPESAGTGPLNIAANGFSGGKGGLVDVETFANSSNLLLGGGTDGSLHITAPSGATGGNGGTIIVKAGHNLTVANDSPSFNANPQGTDGNGQTLTFVAGNSGGAGDLFVNTSLASNGVGNGTGGQINLQTNSSTIFNVGTGSVSPGANGTLTANAGATSGGGGVVSVTNQGSGGVNIGATTNISAQASTGAAGGSGGTITLNATSGALVIPVSGATGSATATLEAGATGPGPQNGGTINLNGNTVATSTALPPGPSLTLDVHGVGNGNAGTVNTTQGSGPIAFDGSPGNFQINATSGNGAIINIKTPGTLTYDPNVNPYLPQNPNGTGAQITLNSTSGNLFVEHSLSADGLGTGAGGLISLSSNSPGNTPFNIASGATINGVNGTLSANGGPTSGNAGEIDVFDHAANAGAPNSSGIIVGNTTNISASATNGTGGTIQLLSDNRTILFQNGSSLNANAGGANDKGGVINISGTAINSSAIAGLTFNAEGSGTGDGGAIHLTATDSTIGSIALGNGSAQVQVNANSGTGATGNGGSVTIDAAVNITGSGGSVNVNSLATNGNGGILKMHAGNSGNGHIQINGSLSANANGTGNGGTVEITSPFNNNFEIGGNGADLDFVTGLISANAPSTGTGGTVNLVNTRSGSPLNIDFAAGGKIDSGSQQGKFGNVNLYTAGDWNAAGNPPAAKPLSASNPASGELITVVNLVAGAGQISGFVTAVATALSIKTDAAGARLDVGTMLTSGLGTVGTINLESSNASGGNPGIVSVGEGNILIAADNVTSTSEVFIDNTQTFQSLKNNGQILVQSPTGNGLSVTGEGFLTLKGTGAGNQIEFQVPDGQTLNIFNNLTMQPNDDHSQIIYQAGGVGGKIVIGAGLSQSIGDGAEVVVHTPFLEMGAGSSIIGAPPAGRTTSITVDSGPTGSQGLTFQLDGNASLVAAGGGGFPALPTINIGPTAGTSDGTNLHFVNNAAGVATLSLLGGDVTTHIASTGSVAAKELIDSNLTITSDHNITMTANNTSSSFISEVQNNGSVISTKSGGTINVTSTGDLQVDGTSGLWKIAAGGANQQINLTASSGSLTGHMLNISGTQTYDPGTLNVTDQVNFNSPICPTGSTNIAGTQTVSDASNNKVNLTINSGLVTFANSSSVQVVNPNVASVGLKITCPSGCDLTVQLPAGGTTTLGTTGSQFQVEPGSAGHNIAFTTGTLLFQGGTATIETDNGSITNNGIIEATTTATTNLPGSIVIQQDPAGTGPNLTIPNLGTVLVNPASANAGAGGTIQVLNTKGALSIQNGSLNASATGAGNAIGGTITISANSISSNGGLSITDNGAGTSKGGAVNVTSTVADINFPIIGTSNLNITALGGSGGGIGGTITVSAAQNLTFNAPGVNSFNANGQGGGAGGTINMTAGSVSAGSMNTNVNLTANGSGAGNGGSITLKDNTTGSITDSGSINADALLAAGGGAGGTIQILNSPAASSGGGIVVTTTTVSAQGFTNTAVNFGQITIQSGSTAANSGPVSFPTAGTTLNVNAVSSGKGGNVTVIGSSTSDPNGLSVSANAAGVGAGGIVTITALTGALTINSGAGAVSITAEGGTTSGNGGTANVSAGTNLTINALNGSSAFNVNPQGNGNGGIINLTAATNASGNLISNVDLVADGKVSGNGGAITLSNSSTGNIQVNGSVNADADLGGTGTGAGGTVKILNNDNAAASGGITVQGNVSAIGVNNTAANFGQVTIDAGDTSFPASSAHAGPVILDGTSISTNANTSGKGGNVTVKGSFVTVPNGLAVTANAAGTGVGGTVVIVAEAPTGSITNDAGAGNINVTAKGAGNGVAGNGGNISLIAGLNITLNNTGTLSAQPTGSNSNGGNITLKASQSANNGSIVVNPTLDVTGTGTGTGGTITIINNSKNSITLNGAPNSLVANGGTSGTILVQNNGSGGTNGGINVTGNLTATSSTTGPLVGSTAITVDASGNGSGNVLLSTGTINTDVLAGGTGTGGGILVQGANFTLGGTAGTISSNGAGIGGNGGTVTITSFGATSVLTLGAAGTGTFAITANATGTGSGGTINVTSGNDLTALNTAILQANAATQGTGGTIDLTASNSSGSGTMTVNLAIVSNGAGTGKGGIVTLLSKSSNAITDTATINADGSNASASSAGGGTITIRNTGNGVANGGINISGALSAQGTNSGGGIITLDATNATLTNAQGPVLLTNGPSINASAASGAGASAGGVVTIEGGAVTVTGATAANVNAYASGTGNGGSIIIIANTPATLAFPNNGNVDIGAGGGNLNLSATGGGIGSLAGDGGTVSVTAATNLIATGSINVLPTGSGKGGNITLNQGYQGVGAVANSNGLLQFTGNLNANGSGTFAGDGGGTITIEYQNATGALTVGAVTAGSFISGQITSNTSSATATGGTININTNQAPVGGLPLNVTLDTVISATGTVPTALANFGNINFNQAGQNVSVTGAVNVPGELLGFTNANGSTVLINPQEDTTHSTTLTAGTIVSSTGNATLQVACCPSVGLFGGNVLVPAGKSATTSSGSTSVLNMIGQTVTVNGTATSAGEIAVLVGGGASGSFTNSGTVVANGAVAGVGLTIDNCSASSSALTVNLSGFSTTSTTAAGAAMEFNAVSGPGAITVSGAGSLNTNNGNVIVNGGTTGIVSLTPTSINTGTGSIQQGGFAQAGSQVIISVSQNNLNVGPLTTTSSNIQITDSDNSLNKGSITVSGLLKSATTAQLTTGNSPGQVAPAVPATNVTFQGTGGINAAGQVSITTPVVNFLAADSITSTGGGVSIDSNRVVTNPNSLVVNMFAGSSISANGAVNFNGNVAGGGQIQVIGGVGDLSGASVGVNGGASSASINVNSINCCVQGLGGAIGPVGQTAALGGSNVSVQVASGNAGIQNLAATGSISDITTDVNGQANVCSANISAGTTLTMTSGSNPIGGQVNVASGSFVNAASATITTPNLNLLGTASVATNGAAGSNTLAIQSNATGGNPNLLTVAMVTGSNLTGAGPVNFNPTTAGQIGVTGAGTIGGTSVGVNGGAKSVNINVTAVNCCVQGLGALTGSVAGQQSALGGSSVSLTVSSGNAGIQNLASTGAISAITTDVNGQSNVCSGNINAATSLTMTSGTSAANGQVNIAAGSNANGGTVLISTPTLNFGINGTLNSTTGNVNVDSNSTAANALSVNMTAGSKITGANNANINFNQNVVGGAQITVNGPGSLLAAGTGTVGVNGGTKDVSITVAAVNCCVVGLGALTGPAGQQAPLGGNNVTLSVTTGNAQIGNITATGNLTESIAGVADPNGQANICSTAAGNGNVNVTGALTITSGTSGSSTTPAITATAGIINAGSVEIKTPTLNMNSKLTATTGAVNIDSNAAAGTLQVTLAAGSSINGANNQNINFNQNATAGSGAITVTGQGSLLAAGTGTVGVNGGAGNVSFNVKAINCCVVGLGANSGPLSVPLGGNNVSVTVSSGNVGVGPLSANGTLTMATTDVNGQANICDNVSAVGLVTMTSGSDPVNGQVNIPSGKSLDGGSFMITTPNLNLIGTAILKSTGAVGSADVDIQSNATGGNPNLLTVTLGNGSQLNGNNGAVNFNYNNSASPAGTLGQISVTGQGAISGSSVGVNGGTKSATINVASVNCCVQGLGALTGSVAGQQSALGGSSVSLTVSSGNAGIQNLASTGAISALTTDVNGQSNVCSGNINAATSLTMTSGTSPANGQVNIAAGSNANGGTVLISTPTLNFGINGTLNSTTGNVNVDSNSTAANALSVNMTAGSKITGANNANINFNQNVVGGAQITVNGPGSLLAAGTGTVGVNGGTKDVSITVAAVNCCVVGLGALTGPAGQQAPLGGNNVTLSVTTGNAQIGNITATGNLTESIAGVADPNGQANICSTAAGNGNVNVTGALTITSGTTGSSTTPAITATAGIINAGSVEIKTPTLNMNSKLTATTGAVNIDSNAAAGALQVTLAAGSSINGANNQNINFNQNATAGSGAITVTGQGSLLAAGTGTVGVNGGAAGDVSFNVKTINCCVVGLGANGGPLSVPLGGNNVSVTVSSGNVGVGPLSANGTLTMATTDVNGQANICDNVSAVGLVTMTSGSDPVNGQVNIPSGKSLDGGSFMITTPNLNLNGTAILKSTGAVGSADVDIQSNATGGNPNLLTVTLGNGSQLNGNNGAVNFNYNNSASPAGTPGQISVSGQGAISGSSVGVNGGTKSATINVASVNCCVQGLGALTGSVAGQQSALGGSSVSLTVSSGNAGIQNLASTGAISAITTDLNGQSNVCSGNINAATSLTMTSGTSPANGQVNIAAGSNANGGTVLISTPTLNFGTNGTLNSTTGNVNVDSNSTAANALSVNMTAGSKITGANNANINFNQNVVGGAQITVNGPGSLLAAGTGTVGVNGGTKDVSITVAAVNCCVVGLGALTGPAGQQAPLGGNNVTLSVTTGNAQIGNITATGNLTESIAGVADPNGQANICSTAAGNGNVNVTGALTITSGTTGSSTTPAITATAGIINAGSVEIKTPTLNMNSTLTAKTGAINIDSNAAAGALQVTLAAGSSINGANNQNINFNQNATAGSGAITVTGQGSLLASGTGTVGVNGGAAGDVNINVAAVNCCVVGLGASTGPLSLPLGGNNVSVTVSSGNVQVGPLAANGSLSMVTTDPNGQSNICDNVSSGGLLTMTSGSNGQVNIPNGKQIDAGSMMITTPTLNLLGNAALNITGPAGTAFLDVQSNGTNNDLTVNMGSSSALNGGAGPVNFNFNNGATPNGLPGQITVTGPGSISGQSVGVNGGTNTATINVSSINCCVQGLGALTGPAGQQSALGGTDVSITVSSGNAGIQNLAATGSITALTTDPIGQSNVCSGNINAGTTLTMTSGTDPVKGQVNIANGSIVNGGTVAITTPNLNILGNGALNSTTNGVNIDSNSSNGALNVTMGTGSTITGANNQNINFNQNVSGGGQITVNGPGSILAAGSGTVGVNGGTKDVSITVAAVNCCVVGLGALTGSTPGQQAPLGGNNVTLTVTSGNAQLGNISSIGNMTEAIVGAADPNGQANICSTAAGGNVNVGGLLSITSGTTGSSTTPAIVSGPGSTGFINVGSAEIKTPTLNMNSDLTANTGAVNIDSNAVNGALQVNLASGSSVNGANNQPINFNQNASAGSGAITVTGQGSLLASGTGTVGVNGGAGAVSLDVKAINCCVVGLGAATGPQNTPLGGTNVSVQVTSGNVKIGPIASNGTLTAITTDVNGQANVCDNVNATGLVTLTSGSDPTNGQVNIPSGKNVNGGSFMITTPNLNLNGTAALTSTGPSGSNDLDVQSNAAGNALKITLGTGSTITGTGAVNFNYNNGATPNGLPGQINVTGQGAISGTSVGVNGGTNSVVMTVGSINCCVVGLGAGAGPLNAPLGGSSVTVSVSSNPASGSPGIGPLSSPGAIRFDDTASGGNVNICGDTSGQTITINSAAVTFTGTNTLQSTGGAINFNQNIPGVVNVTGPGNLISSTTVGINGGTSPATINVNSINCCVVGLGSATAGPQNAPVGGTNITLQVASGNIQVGPLAANGNLSATTTDVNGQANACSNLNATGSLTLTSGSDPTNGQVNIPSGVNINGGSITITTPNLNLQGGNLTSTGPAGSNTINIDGNSTGANPNSVNVNVTAPSNITSAGAIDFNGGVGANGGKITVTGPAVIIGKSVGVNGGASNPVSINVTSINCCVQGLGAAIGSPAAALGGSSVSLQVSSGNIGMQNLASTGDISEITTDANGQANVCSGNIVADGKITIQSGTKGQVNIPSGSTVAGGNGDQITTPTFNVNGSLTSSTGPILIDSNAGGPTNPLQVNMGTGSQITGGSKSPVNFNPANPGLITVTGPGVISGGSVGVNGGTNSVAITVKSVNCCVNGLGPVEQGLEPNASGVSAPLGGSSILLTVTNGSTGVGPLYSPGSIIVANGDSAAGNVNICGNVDGQSVLITTPTITFTNPATIGSDGGGVKLQGDTDKTNSLTINFAPNSGIRAPGQSIKFNPSAPGPITANNGNGDIFAGSVGVNGGTTGKVILDVNTINCCVSGLGPERPVGSGVPLGGLSVTVHVASGNVGIGPISAIGQVKASTVDPDGKVNFCGPVISNAPPVLPPVKNNVNNTNLITVSSVSTLSNSANAAQVPFIPLNLGYITNGLTPNDLSNNQIYEVLAGPLVYLYNCAPRKLYVKKDSSLPDLNEWLLVDNDRQPYDLASEGAFILADTGAEFAYTVKSTISQRAGRLAVFSNKEPIAVKVGDGRFTLAANSVLVLDVTDPDKFSAICAEGTCTFDGATGHGPVSMKAFDQAKITSNTQKVLTAELSKISSDILAGDKLLKKETCCDPVQKHRIHDVRESLNRNNPIKPGSISSTPDEDKPEMNEIAFQQMMPTVNGGPAHLQTVTDKGFDFYTVGNTRYSTPSPNHIVLTDGEMVVVAKNACDVVAGNTTYHIARGTTASIICKSGVSSVKNLSDEWVSKSGVTVTINGKAAGTVAIGCERIVGSSPEAIKQFISSNTLGRRKSSLLDYSAQHVVQSTSEFSLVSYFIQSPVMQNLYKSSGTPRQVIDRLMKLAVGMNLITAGHGNFSSSTGDDASFGGIRH